MHPRHALCAILLLGSVALVAADKPRVVIQTDCGGDPDDQATLVRWLLYTNEWEVEGIIADNHMGTDRLGATNGVELIGVYLDAYDQIDEQLREHDPDYPTAAYLRSKLVSSMREPDMPRDTGGRDLMIALAADTTDPRPIWYGNWGTGYNLFSDVLVSYHNEYRLDPTNPQPEAEARRFLRRYRLHTLGRGPIMNNDAAPRWYRPFVYEEMAFYIDNGGHGEKDWPYDGTSYYHMFGSISGNAGTDMKLDIQQGHGPLGALYTTQKEGDSWCVVGTIPDTGLDDLQHPHWGGWAGRYAHPINPAAPHPRFRPNQVETGPDGLTTLRNTARRWGNDAQSDFLCRLDWCLMTYAQANHAPKAVLQGDTTWRHLTMSAARGTTVDLSAAGSSDPDSGDTLRYQWQWYQEAGNLGTYETIKSYSVPISGPDQQDCQVTIPASAPIGEEIHIVVRVIDDGSRKGGRIRDLTRYRRMVMTVTEGDLSEPPQITAGPSVASDPVTGTSTGVGVTASDDGGAAQLGYQWSASGPAPVQFVDPAADRTTVNFGAAGTYTLAVAVRDGDGQTVTGSVTVTVVQTASGLLIEP